MKQKEILLLVFGLLSVFSLFGTLKPPKSPRGASYCYVTQQKQSFEARAIPQKKLPPITQVLSPTAQAAVARGKKEASEAALGAETVLQFMRAGNGSMQTHNVQGQQVQSKPVSLLPPEKSKRLSHANSMPQAAFQPPSSKADKPHNRRPKILTVRPKPVSTVPGHEEQISQPNPATPSLVAIHALRIDIQGPQIPPATASSQSSPTSGSLKESKENTKESPSATGASNRRAEEPAQIVLPVASTDTGDQECCSCLEQIIMRMDDLL